MKSGRRNTTSWMNFSNRRSKAFSTVRHFSNGWRRFLGVADWLLDKICKSIIKASGKHVKQIVMAEVVVEKCDFLALKLIHSLLDNALKCPNQHQNVVKELLHVLKETDITLKCLRTTLAFHKSLRPAAVFILERRLLASGILHEGNMAKPCLSSLLSRILFGLVSASSTECADYCASVWIERYLEPHANGRNI